MVNWPFLPKVDTRSGPAGANGRKAMAVGLLLTLLFCAAEALGGYLTNSLALVSDALHMLTDSVALGLGLFAMWIASRPATDSKTYGYYRAEILAALTNGVLLWGAVIGIFYKAYQRVLSPPVVNDLGMLLVGLVGFSINIIVALTISRQAARSLNVRAALLHVLSDLLGSLGVIASAIVIMATGWTTADAAASFSIGVLILVGSWGLVREAVDVLMEAVPRHINVAEVKRMLESVEGAEEVHDLHVWTLTQGKYALSAHVVIDGEVGGDWVVDRMAKLLSREFAIDHSTIQVEVANRCPVKPVH